MSTTQGEPITAATEHQLAGRSLGWWGMIFFITSEALIFANFNPLPGFRLGLLHVDWFSRFTRHRRHTFLTHLFDSCPAR